jgi:hypothetical protein
MMEERAKALGAKPISHDPKKKAIKAGAALLTPAAGVRR